MVEIERLPLPEDQFFFFSFSPPLPNALLCLPSFFHLRNILANSSVNLIIVLLPPTVKLGVQILRHHRCAVRRVLSLFLLNIQISWQGLITRFLTLLRSWHSELRHLTFRLSSRLFFPLRGGCFARQHLSGALDEPYVSFPSPNLYIQRCWWSRVGLQRQVATTLSLKALNIPSALSVAGKTQAQSLFLASHMAPGTFRIRPHSFGLRAFFIYLFIIIIIIIILSF